MNSRYQLKTQRYSSHSRIFSLLEKAPAGSRILDVGTAGGYIGRHLSGSRIELTGIEKDAALIEQAGPYYQQLLQLDLDRDELPVLEPFDFIILADILEHLQAPSEFLGKISSILKDEGKIIVSVPNIAHWTVRFQLAFGNFNYRQRGILDRGHLRFFTLKTARELIRRANFKINGFSATPIPFELFIKPSWIAGGLNRLYYIFTKFAPQFFGYQFVFTAVKNNL